jgi:crotonobetainyl-CoA:carnitine CoA-transferase CaiB-like acyl-CoA transferase
MRPADRLEATMTDTYAPLRGVRILDMATVVAAPLGATLCTDLGAETVKLELPDGSDTLRSLAPIVEGRPVWWKVANRGKRGITLDVRTPAGRELFLKLVAGFDVLVENFRTGTLDRWDLGSEVLFAANPRLTIVRLTGFGQTGPYASRPGFARVFEALAGYTSLTGGTDGVPLHADFPLGDAVAGLYTAFCIAAEVARLRADPEARGAEIDLSASEALMRLLDPIPAEWSLLKKVRRPSGSAASYTAPSSIYRSRDGFHFSMAASSDEMFRRLALGLDRPEWLRDTRFADGSARVANGPEINGLVATIFASKDYASIAAVLEAIAVPFAKVNSIAEVVQDAHFVARGAIVHVEDTRLGRIATPCVVPRAVGLRPISPDAGPDVGQHNDEVYAALGLTPGEIGRLRAQRVI